MGWSAYGIAQYLGALLYGKAGRATRKVILIAALSGFVLSAPLRYICRWLWTEAACRDDRRRAAGAYVTALAWRVIVNLAYATLVRGRHGRMTHWYDYFSGAMSCDLSDGVLDRPVLRLPLLRVDADAARSGAARLGAGAGSAAQDVALPAQSAFPVQHAQRDLDADPRQSQHRRRTPPSPGCQSSCATRSTRIR